MTEEEKQVFDRDLKKVKTSFIAILIVFLLAVSAAFSQVGIGTTTPRGALDIASTTNGLIIPIVSLTATNVAAPVLNPQGGALVNGTVVYNTNSTTGVNGVTTGEYTWNGTKWTPNFGVIPVNGGGTTLNNTYEYSGIVSLGAGTGLWNINISGIGFTTITSVQLTAERTTTDIRFIPLVSMTASPTTTTVFIAIMESNTVTGSGQGLELSPTACNIHMTIKGTR